MQQTIELGNRQPNHKVLIFLHIMKAGGTTLNGIINQQYPNPSIFRVNGINNRNQIQTLSRYQRKKLKLIRGHFAFGLHYFLDCPATYFTMIRDPVTRFISNYYYQQRRIKDEKLKQLSLEDFVWLRGKEQANTQTKMLCGLTPKMENRTKETMLQIAKDNLDNYFSSVGLLERFDESLVLFRKQFNWNFPFYLQQNKSINKPNHYQNLSQEALNSLREYNAIDIELYKYVSQKFQKEIDDMGKSFNQELNLQKYFNKLYQPLGTVYNYARNQYFKYIGNY